MYYFWLDPIKLLIIYFQAVVGQITSYSGQSAVNIEQNLPFSSNLRCQRSTGHEATELTTEQTRIARNVRNIGNVLANARNSNNFLGNANICPSQLNTDRALATLQNTNFAKSNQVNANLANVNTNYGIANQANMNLRNAAFPPNIASKNSPGQNLANSISSNNFGRNNANLRYNGPNQIANSNSNVINSELTNQLQLPNFAFPTVQKNANPILNNGFYNSPATVKTNYGSHIANLANTNPASRTNFSGGSNIAKGKLANSMMPGSTFAISGNPFTVPSEMPGNYGLNIVANALEAGGAVSVVGKIPIHGTVSISGTLSSGGAAIVNNAA